MKVKYIDNKQNLGIEYDWVLIKKEYNKLGVPSGYYEIPWKAIQEGNKYIMSLSERSTGKTTNLGLLVGLVMHKLYKTQVVYIRPTEDELSASHAQKLVEVIKTYNEGHYIKALTDGEYNSIYYHWRQFYYCWVNEVGEIEKKSNTPIIQMLSVSRSGDYKSTLNLPLGDWIVYDEFIGKYYRPDEAIHFLDLLKTVIRDRMSPVVCMLANTINLNSQYFEEFEISREVRKLNKGDKRTIVTDRGTKIYVEIINLVRRDNTHSILNSMFYGFRNPKIASITGGDVWAFECVPHILRDCTDKRVLARNLYIESGLELLQIEIVYNQEQGLHLEIHRASKTYPDSIIFTIGDQKDNRYYFGLGHGNLNKLLTKYITARKVYYSSNEVGSIFKDYLNRYLMIKNQY